MEMTPEQALQILAQASGQVSANREVHLQILKAIEILQEVLRGKK